MCLERNVPGPDGLHRRSCKHRRNCLLLVAIFMVMLMLAVSLAVNRSQCTLYDFVLIQPEHDAKRITTHTSCERDHRNKIIIVMIKREEKGRRSLLPVRPVYWRGKLRGRNNGKDEENLLRWFKGALPPNENLSNMDFYFPPRCPRNPKIWILAWTTLGRWS